MYSVEEKVFHKDMTSRPATDVIIRKIVRIGMLARRQSCDLPHCSIKKVIQTLTRQVADVVSGHRTLPHDPAPVVSFTLHL
jgi:hypothetical protein